MNAGIDIEYSDQSNYYKMAEGVWWNSGSWLDTKEANTIIRFVKYIIEYEDAHIP